MLQSIYFLFIDMYILFRLYQRLAFIFINKERKFVKKYYTEFVRHIISCRQNIKGQTCLF